MVNRKSLTLLSLLGLLLTSADLPAAEKKPFDATDLVTMKRLSDPAVSPDSRQVAFTLRTTDLDADKGRTDLYLLDLRAGSVEPRQLTRDPANDSSPQWGPDSKSLYFLSSRSGSSQVWRLDPKAGEPVQVTDFPVSVGSYRIAPDASLVAFTASVFPDCETLQCSADKLKAMESGKVSGQLYDQLFVRHWDHWLDGTLSQLFSVSLDKSGKASGTPVPLSASLAANVPSSPFGGNEEYRFSPDSRSLVFSARLADRQESWSTNFDLYQVPVNGGKLTPLTSENLAWDTQPRFSPDGKQLAWLAMARPGFEADRFQVMLRDLDSGKTRSLSADWDRSFADLEFTADGKHLLVSGNHLGNKALWRLDPATGKHEALVDNGYVAAFAPSGQGVVYVLDTLSAPADLYYLPTGERESRQLTEVNKAALGEVAMGDFEQFRFKGWNDETVYGYVVKPANYQTGRKYPVAFLIHGGPQGSFGNHFHYRWNPQTYAGQGYAAIMIDFHGSTGYGQDFTDSISGDWGGKPLEDLQKGLAAALDKYAFLDADRTCALGASYGGYMVNWIAGNWPEQFTCLVNHDGIFDNRMMYYATEELWFPEWEHGGPLFKNPDAYEKHNPVRHVDNWSTPMLVVHGALDYRVPETQGLATFTALQRRNIESQLLIFPDENHWVLKPNNSILWHQVVNDWLERWLK